MKSGGKFSRLEAIKQSLKETLTNTVEKGVVREWQDSKILPQKSTTVFEMARHEELVRGLTVEPAVGLVGGLVHLF